jgi:hypothetical protein
MALGDFYPSGSLLWSDKTTHTHRNVPADKKMTAEELNALRDSVYDLRTGLNEQSGSLASVSSSVVELSSSMPRFGGPAVSSIQGFWVGSSAPPDSTWIWIVTSTNPGQPVSVSAVAAAFGLTAYAPSVAALSYTQIQAAAASLGFAPIDPEVQLSGAPRSISAGGVALGIQGQSPEIYAIPSPVAITLAAVALGLAAPAPTVTALQPPTWVGVTASAATLGVSGVNPNVVAIVPAAENSFRYYGDSVKYAFETAVGSPNIVNVQDNPDSPDSNWIASQGFDRSPVLRVSFPNQPGTLTAGADQQEFRVLVRKFRDVPATGTVCVQLWQSGSFIRAGSSVPVTSLTGQIVSFLWNASELSPYPSGTYVECQVAVTESLEATSVNRNSADIGAIVWNGKSNGYLDFYDEFIGPSGTVLAWYESGTMTGSATVSAYIPTSLGTYRCTKSGGGAVYLRTTASFTNVVGRTVFVNRSVIVDGLSADFSIALIGASSSYDFKPYLSRVSQSDGPKGPVDHYGQGVRVSRRNPSNDLLIGSISESNCGQENFFPDPPSFKLIFGSGSATIYGLNPGTGFLDLNLGEHSIADLGSTFKLGFNLRAPTNLDVQQVAESIIITRE